MSKKIPVYSPDGAEEHHTLLNARDLVNGAGYSWQRGQASNPAANAPMSVRPKKRPTKTAAQEAIDIAGAQVGDDIRTNPASAIAAAEAAEYADAEAADEADAVTAETTEEVADEHHIEDFE